MAQTLRERRTAVLETAARLLITEGPQALSVRRVSAAAGGSTQMIYTLFGGKGGLADALYAEAFDRLAAQIHASGFDDVEPGDPESLIRVGRAYRRWAVSDPGFFAIIFGKAIPDFTPDPEARAAGRAKTFGRVVEAAQACMDAGTLAAPDAFTLAGTCWAATHGLASLETTGIIGSEDGVIGREEADAFAEYLLHLMLEAHRPLREPRAMPR